MSAERNRREAEAIVLKVVASIFQQFANFSRFDENRSRKKEIYGSIVLSVMEILASDDLIYFGWLRAFRNQHFAGLICIKKLRATHIRRRRAIRSTTTDEKLRFITRIYAQVHHEISLRLE